MQKRKTSVKGLTFQNGSWWLDKQINGVRFRRNCETDKLKDVEEYLVHFVEEQRKANLLGIRPERTFFEAAEKYALDHQEKRSIKADLNDLKMLMPFIGDLPLSKVYSSALDAYKAARKKDGVKSATVNRSISVLNRILKLATEEWRDERGLSWLLTYAPISKVKWGDKHIPRPITWKEQKHLLSYLPDHLVEMCLYAVNTASREQEICQLKWKWEVPFTELGTSGFILPGSLCKNKEPRLVILNAVAMAVVNRPRGKHEANVFTYKGRPVAGMNETSFKKQRARAGMSDVRVHDLRHTTATRLKAAGVSQELISDILGHHKRDITEHYTASRISDLLKALRKIENPIENESVTVNEVLRKFREVSADCKDLKKSPTILPLRKEKGLSM